MVGTSPGCSARSSADDAAPAGAAAASSPRETARTARRGVQLDMVASRRRRFVRASLGRAERDDKVGP
jgi:hypothetical protein